MRLAELLQKATSELKNAGVSDYDIDARLLLQSCLGKTRTELYLEAESDISSESQLKYRQFIERRKKT